MTPSPCQLSTSDSEGDLDDSVWSLNAVSGSSNSHAHHFLLDEMICMAELNYILMEKTEKAMGEEIQWIADERVPYAPWTTIT
jgi:hypothetical protein